MILSKQVNDIVSTQRTNKLGDGEYPRPETFILRSRKSRAIKTSGTFIWFWKICEVASRDIR